MEERRIQKQKDKQKRFDNVKKELALVNEEIAQKKKEIALVDEEIAQKKKEIALVVKKEIALRSKKFMIKEVNAPVKVSEITEDMKERVRAEFKDLPRKLRRKIDEPR